MIDGMNAYYKRKGNKKVKRDIVESSITLLQAVERCFVVHVDGPEDTAQWLFNVTSDLGIKPHKRIRDSFLPFCTDTKVKCGTSKTDTYKKMLQQIHGITESAADGVIQEVPTLRMLFEGYEEENDVLVRYERLKSVTISNRKDGVAKSRILNQASATINQLSLDLPIPSEGIIEESSRRDMGRRPANTGFVICIL
ncbi:DNA excision repair protein ERCC-4 [Ceratobasidium sp. AG-Ba]|nr:DNA excision repair protein ERCC-4 [Ceratobasidium sp. AG-Ba]